jgi:phosphoserine aminotransferase
VYVHITPNETIDGIELRKVNNHHTLVADMTSCLLMQSIDINDYGLIYCGTQKTVGIAGLTIVIVRDDLLTQAMPQTPEMLSYHQHAKDHSIVNTAPVFACYVTQLMLDWVQQNGGVDALTEQAEQRAQLLYAAIDEHPGLINTVHPANRSNINVVFDFVRDGAFDDFIQKAAESGLYGLQGHRLKGGIRASMYNGTPMQAVEKLREIMLTVA